MSVGGRVPGTADWMAAWTDWSKVDVSDTVKAGHWVDLMVDQSVLYRDIWTEARRGRKWVVLLETPGVAEMVGSMAA